MTEHNIDPHAPDTEVIAVPEPAPVFVDSTGRRSRLLRRVALAFGVVLIGYVGLVSVSLAGGPISSSAVLPLPGLDDEPEPEATPPPTPEPAPSATASARILESATRTPEQRRPIAAPTSRKASPVPSKSPTPKPSVSTAPSPSVTKPLESASVSRSPEPSATSPTPQPPVAPSRAAP
ncbi:hypothetical protein [Actinoplanes couchii]|uniref:Uncharacterized protein n=1 Tax=Actinoplanes couchii TaxID=403638 RepID=A0ABQ3X9W2_9ACTN|nr:hypothetical protein [Actinoplanes couchii]MDR6325074.1 hypothetical protein [Actinoplanes couchii]GID55302.1 hypothetical protein Aco03nite_037060 [Actinoplanes couchii]